MYAIKLKPLLISILISVGVGAFAGIITTGTVDFYDEIQLPGLSPPSFVFPIVWSVLYILMGVSAYMVYSSEAKSKNTALKIYGVQLLLNSIWPLIFFNMRRCLFAFVIIVFLWAMIFLMMVLFWKINKKAALLQIPYILWVSYAAYLNISICILNN
ncbi:MAG: tryptophan-rich sensory protein [Eubacteriales bacterium]|nr:tryptophan-rich sensory protein [Eubacteriales bacterium]MDD4422353.1 tryptophan-rich sensory protein [Eubacteriales bacterium]